MMQEGIDFHGNFRLPSAGTCQACLKWFPCNPAKMQSGLCQSARLSRGILPCLEEPVSLLRPAKQGAVDRKSVDMHKGLTESSR